MKKKLWLVFFLCCVISIVSNTYFKTENVIVSYAASNGTLSQEDEVQLKSILDTNIEQWNTIDFDLFMDEQEQELMDSGNEAFLETLKEWKQLRGEVGEFVSIGEETNLEENGEIITMSVPVKYTNGSILAKVVYDTSSGMVNFAVESLSSTKTSLSDTLGKAGLNTIMGITIVILSLFLISLVIGLFKYIPKIMDSLQKKDTLNQVEEKIEQKIEPVEEVFVEEELTDDLELVAVITAAISASMGEEVPADGLVVRSIRKRKSNRW